MEITSLTYKSKPPTPPPPPPPSYAHTQMPTYLRTHADTHPRKHLPTYVPTATLMLSVYIAFAVRPKTNRKKNTRSWVHPRQRTMTLQLRRTHQKRTAMKRSLRYFTS